MKPVQKKYVKEMNKVARMIERAFNAPGKRRVGFVLLVAEFDNIENGRVNYIINGQRQDMLAMLREYLARADGRGRDVIDRSVAESECLALLPDPHDLPVFVAKRTRDVRHGLPIMNTGYSNEDDEDWCIVATHWTEADAVGQDAMDDAKVIAAILNAYRLGLIVPRLFADQTEDE